MDARRWDFYHQLYSIPFLFHVGMERMQENETAGDLVLGDRFDV